VRRINFIVGPRSLAPDRYNLTALSLSLSLLHLKPAHNSGKESRIGVIWVIPEKLEIFDRYFSIQISQLFRCTKPLKKS
jgi:hypothetical protein